MTFTELEAVEDGNPAEEVWLSAKTAGAMSGLPSSCLIRLAKMGVIRTRIDCYGEYSRKDLQRLCYQESPEYNDIKSIKSMVRNLLTLQRVRRFTIDLLSDANLDSSIPQILSSPDNHNHRATFVLDGQCYRRTRGLPSMCQDDDPFDDRRKGFDRRKG